MSEPLNVLVIEDSEDDTLLIIRELRRNGFDPSWQRVETAEELSAMLENRLWDIILSDYTLPHFSAPFALDLVKQFDIDIPFIVVAGSIGEQLAVEMMKAGAHDYVMKDSLARLPEAVRRELRDAENRAERKRAQAMLFHNARHDHLTNLPNRASLTERLDLAINRVRRNPNYRYAVLFLDLDRFKVVNDSLGHVVGDQLLVETAKRLTRHIRDIDMVARLGGDEFIILLEDINNTEEVVRITERILADSQMPMCINDYEIFTSFSIGIVLGTPDYAQAVDLIRDADIAMYRAKAEGNNTYQFFDAVMHTQAMDRLTLETDLRRAIENEEFNVNYQPIINLQNLQLAGFEALVRWQHPQRGFISPSEFIPIAEETGLITLIDHWVFQRACRQLACWQKQFPDNDGLKISINFSAQDLLKSTLFQDIDMILNETNLDGNAITIEITERLLIDDIERTIDLLVKLAAKQIHISIDDFGTGYSSLNYLHRLPVHALKIDRSFVSQMQVNNRNYQVVSTILALSKQLGLIAVAEGIETQEQLQYLQELGCAFGQGYLFSPPLAADAIDQSILN
ncbi:MAG: EAL domain-containing protein [Leptolyngbyaceae cyanobacterium MAG.088]|nr:EAL domain-containing protein [Leptolyngbyaceae cyanobacterium MAG.088]